MLLWFVLLIILTLTLQHEVVSENIVGSFSARVEAHGCEMYILTPETVVVAHAADI